MDDPEEEEKTPLANGIDLEEIPEEDIDLDTDDDHAAIDGEFTEDRSRLTKVDDKDPERPAIAGEAIIPDGPAQISEDPVENELDRFFADLPTDTGSVSIVVTRKADPKNVTFRIPCRSEMDMGSLVWSGESPDAVHDDIRATEGGGHYRFQIRYGKGFSARSWTKLIADPPTPSTRERTMREAAKSDEQPRTIESSPAFTPAQAAPPADPIDPLESMKKQLRDAQEIRELLMPAQPAAAAAPMSAEDTIKITLFEKLSGNPAFSDKLTDYAFGIFEKKPEKETESFWDVARAAFKNPQESLTLIGGLLSIGKDLFFGGSKGEQQPAGFQLPPGAVPSMPHVIPWPPPTAPPTQQAAPALAEADTGFAPPEGWETAAQGTETPPAAPVVEVQEFVKW
jgi:hypothetical protein